MFKIVIAVVPGWAVGVVTHCTSCATSPSPPKSTLCSNRPMPMSPFDAGYGSAYLARQIGRKAREIFSSDSSIRPSTPFRWEWSMQSPHGIGEGGPR